MTHDSRRLPLAPCPELYQRQTSLKLSALRVSLCSLARFGFAFGQPRHAGRRGIVAGRLTKEGDEFLEADLAVAVGVGRLEDVPPLPAEAELSQHQAELGALNVARAVRVEELKRTAQRLARRVDDVGERPRRVLGVEVVLVDLRASGR